MLNIGDVLILESREETLESYKCKVVEMDEEYIYIDYPINAKNGKTAFMINETKLAATFVGKDQNAYHFTTQVRGKRKEKIPMMLLTNPSKDKVEKIQRREYIRIETGVNAAIHPLNNEFEPFTALTIDISAGGTAILIPENTGMDQNHELMVWLALPFQNVPSKYIKIQARTIRILEESNLKKKAILEFVEISELNRQTIMRFCFDQQILMRKKGIYSE
ncbi:flagellar brake protein [Metabacillus sp. RGM 3146]|uniref:flagellar brake protein n=1 Tax=Metabacillus sp. RGM 3146 TaxID=3401092 RepID=UPI003B9DB544